MTENMKIAITAINKFMFFSWNYKTIQHKWKVGNDQIKQTYVPEFLAKVNWTCNFDHIYEKWNKAIANGNPYSYMPKFYAELDTDNQILLLEWVCENYNSERKII